MTFLHVPCNYKVNFNQVFLNWLYTKASLTGLPLKASFTSCNWALSILLKNIREIEVFLCFHGVQKETGMKKVKYRYCLKVGRFSTNSRLS